MITEEEFYEVVKKFKKTKDLNGEFLNMHYLLMKDEKELFLHRFNDRSEKSDVRSISKTVMTLVFGIANKLSIDGKYEMVDENTYVYPVIKKAIHLRNKENEKYLKQLQVKHLLTHTIGYEDVLLMRDDIKDMDPYSYSDYLINHPIVHEPGTHHLYSNAGFYLLSMFLQEFLQEDLFSFINRELFKPLNIKDVIWEKYGNYLAGATRLWLYPEDLLKIGELILNVGVYDGKVLINEDWLNKMLNRYFYTEDVDTPNAIFRRYAYGYGIWMAKEDFYFGHGTDGQLLIILPKTQCIIITQAYQHGVESLEKIIDEVVTQVVE